MKNKKLLLTSLLVFALVMTLSVVTPVHAKKMTWYATTSEKYYRYDTGKKKLMWKSSYSYNGKGHISKSTYTDYQNSKKGKKSTTKYKYKGDNLVKVYYNNKLSDKYTYNSKGDVTKHQVYDHGKVVSASTYTYKKGKLEKIVSKRGKRKTAEYLYYSNGNIKSAKWWNEDGSRGETEYARNGSYTSKEYDSAGQLIGESSFESKGNGTEKIYCYIDGERQLQYERTVKRTFKNKVCAKEETTSTNYYQDGTSSTDKWITEYYTSGYRKERTKLYKSIDSEGNISYGKTYSYKQDSTGKNVAVETAKDIITKKTTDQWIYTYKKVTTNVK